MGLRRTYRHIQESRKKTRFEEVCICTEKLHKKMVKQTKRDEPNDSQARARVRFSAQPHKDVPEYSNDTS